MKDGGPAFPTTAGQVVYSHGMSLRDWFAGQALAGCAVDEAHPNLAAQRCYRFADAMLAAREAQIEEGTW